MTLALHEIIADNLREQIRGGDLPVGAALPSESQLCAQWGASRGPVRQALATLRAEGVIAGGRGKRPVVCTAATHQPFDTLLSYSAWAHSIGRSPGQRTLELALRPADEHAATVLGVEVGAPVVQVLRLRYLDDEPAMLERATFVEHVGRRLFDFDCDSGSLWAYLLSQGVRFATASHVIDAVAADRIDATHLGVAEGAPLLRQQRTTRSVDGDVIEYHDDRYLPAIVSFTLENTLDARCALSRNAKPGTEVRP
ncbi:MULTISPECIES: GntR family transcriptional regulator [unclassified Mycobacterium]|uniref:GntR family transcriptional regulator n=1 Tax=unclassified Mycobacterium TaxID=2642494 RepID=UPI0008005A8B|nr:MULTISPECIES: GntR family transcriptional regulator [unclassified Mycobacterium]OBG73478.1 GntR family transcriptional regulator [Mycobacterium sp. E1214]OBH30231.1 GntR family transcriptional regulator [Mycobacterium sp. E1319]